MGSYAAVASFPAYFSIIFAPPGCSWCIMPLSAYGMYGVVSLSMTYRKEFCDIVNAVLNDYPTRP